MTTVNEQHVDPELGYKTPVQYRRTKRLRVLPKFSLIGQKIPTCVGKVTFIRLVSAEGNINTLEQRFKVGN